MPAKSKAQQRFFGMVHAYQKGELDNPSKAIKDAAKSISKKGAKEFAKTKHKGLPNHVKKSKKKSKANESIVRITERDIRTIVMEGVKKVLNEISDPVSKINAAISLANEAFEEAKKYQEDDMPLKDKDDFFGLTAPIVLDGRGYIHFPFKSAYGSYQPERIRVLTKAGGKVKILNGDYFEEGWNDAKKLLKKIIKCAKKGNDHFRDYDPNDED